NRPLPGYFYRLSPIAQRRYLKSDAVESYDFVPGPAALRLTVHLVEALSAEMTSPAIERATRDLADELCQALGVRGIKITVYGVRPHNTRGELHGIFYPARPPYIKLWMRTAQRHQVVKPKTFIRTLLHELGHYFDYSVLNLGDSFHTGGFFKRESSLLKALWPEVPWTSAGAHK
ncbi:MAG: hypothetical protein ACREP6_05590, partial [Candidatus Binataceae bacterium]